MVPVLWIPPLQQSPPPQSLQPLPPPPPHLRLTQVWLHHHTVTVLCSLYFPSGLVVAGGNPSDTSVEYWSPGSPALHCTLPDLSTQMFGGPTLDFTQGRLVACFEDACDFLSTSTSGWQRLTTFGRWRMYHTSTSTSQGLLLVGGSRSSSTTEMVSVEDGETRAGFNLQHNRSDHCSIQLSDSVMVLTGGSYSLSLVTEYSGLDQQEVTTRELPSLLTGRWQHACGSYRVEDRQVN